MKTLEQIVQEQLGAMTFMLCSKDAEILRLQAELTKLRAEQAAAVEVAKPAVMPAKSVKE